MCIEIVLVIAVFIALVAIVRAHKNAQALSRERQTAMLLEEQLARLSHISNKPERASTFVSSHLGNHGPVSLFPPHTNAPDLWVSRLECIRFVLEHPALAVRLIDDAPLAKKVKAGALVTTTQLFLAASYVAGDPSTSPVSKWRKQLTPHLNKHFGHWPHTVAEWRVFFNTKWPSFLRTYLQHTELVSASVPPILEESPLLVNLLSSVPMPTTEAGWVSILKKRNRPLQRRDREATD